MAAKITVSASDVWHYFQENKEELQALMHQIAGSPEYGIAIYVTEDSGLPNIVVTSDDMQVYDETVVSEADCLSTVEKIYDDYLTAKVVTSLSAIVDGDTEQNSLDIEDIISERETELDVAVYEFVLTALNGAYYDDSSANFDDMLEDCKEHFLEYLARKHELPVYRPMILEYEGGEEEMSEYPYEDMEFDDPDNPLYK